MNTNSIFHTFVIAFHAADYCSYSKGERFTPMEKRIQEVIDEYCKEHIVEEIDRNVIQSLCESNGVQLLIVTSKFTNK